MSDPYRRIAQREIYRNPWVWVEAHEIVHPTGVPGEHVLIMTPRASAVLVVDGDNFVLASQPRFGARRVALEIVKGGAEAGETALACAQRELREELGFEARSWTPLGEVWEVPSLVGEPVMLFVARGLTVVGDDPEPVEAVDAVRMPIEQAYRAAIDGRIDDAVTLAALLRYRSLEASSGQHDR